MIGVVMTVLGATLALAAWTVFENRRARRANRRLEELLVELEAMEEDARRRLDEARGGL